MSSTYIRDMNGDVVDAATVTLPPNRNFRSSWVRNGPVIEVDMVAAKAEFRAAAQAAIEARFNGEFGREVITAFLTDDATAKNSLKNALQLMRQVENAAAIDNATTPDELVALWAQHTDKLGPNPYV